MAHYTCTNHDAMETSCNRVTLHITDMHPQILFDVDQQHDPNKTNVAHLMCVCVFVCS